MRLLLFLSIGLSLALAACGERPRTVGITRMPRGSMQSTSPKGRALFSAVLGKQCLPLDLISREIQKDQIKYTLVSTDINVGQVQTGAGPDGCIEFKPLDNPAARAYVTFKSTTVQPLLEGPISGSDIQSSKAIGDALSVSSQDNCNSVTLLKGEYQGSLNVICKAGGRTLALRGSTSAGEVILAYYLEANSLRIVKYVPVELPAGCTSAIFKGQVERITTLITWGDSPKRVEITRDFATLFSKFSVTKNQELEQALADHSAPGHKGAPVGNTVKITPGTYTMLINMPSLDKNFDTQLTCPEAK